MSYLDLLSPATQRRVERYAAMRRAVGDKRFDAWIEKRADQRSARELERAAQNPPAHPYAVEVAGRWRVKAEWVVNGKPQIFNSQSSATAREAYASFYQRYPELADKMRAKLRAKGYDEFGGLLP